MKDKRINKKRGIKRGMVVVMAILLCLSLLPAVHAAEEVGTGDMTVYALRDYWSTLPDGTPAYVGALTIEAVASEGYDPDKDVDDDAGVDDDLDSGSFEGEESIPVIEDSRVTIYVSAALVEGCDVEAAKAEILSLLAPDNVVSFTSCKYSQRALEEIAAYITATYGKEACAAGADTIEVTLGMVDEETERISSQMTQDSNLPSDVRLLCTVWSNDTEVDEDDRLLLPEIDVELGDAAGGARRFVLLLLPLIVLGVAAVSVPVALRRRKAVLQTAAGVNVLQEHGEGERLSRAAVRQRLASEGLTPDESVDARIRGEIE